MKRKHVVMPVDRQAQARVAADEYRRPAPGPQTDGSCCNGTGFADYAAVPCPNPRCPVHDNGDYQA